MEVSCPRSYLLNQDEILGSGAGVAFERRKQFVSHLYEAIPQLCPVTSMVGYKQLSNIEWSSPTELQKENQSTYY